MIMKKCLLEEMLVNLTTGYADTDANFISKICLCAVAYEQRNKFNAFGFAR